MPPCPLMPAPGVGPHAPRQRLASAGCRRQAAGSHRSARTGRVAGDRQPARLELLGGRLLGGGGTVQGLGWALNEAYVFHPDDTMANGSFLDYRMLTCLDVPMIETVILEVPNPRHPFGLRGVGEAPIIPPLAAVANAVYQATGVRMDRLPMSPGNVLAALQARRS